MWSVHHQFAMGFNSSALRLSRVNQHRLVICKHQKRFFSSPSVFSVLYGTLSSLPNRCRSISVKTIVIHPEYQHDESLGVPNDIALLQVSYSTLDGVLLVNFSWQYHSLSVKPCNRFRCHLLIQPFL